MERNAAVVYDASVLFSSSLRDLFVQFGVFALRAKLFRPKWTEQINDEWIRNIVSKYPDVNPSALERTRTLMNIAVRDCLVSGYEQLIEEIVLRDLDDRHVVAAAKKCNLSILANPFGPNLRVTVARLRELSGSGPAADSSSIPEV